MNAARPAREAPGSAEELARMGTSVKDQTSMWSIATRISHASNNVSLLAAVNETGHMNTSEIKQYMLMKFHHPWQYMYVIHF